MRDKVGKPAVLARNLNQIGSKAMRTASRIVGRRPVTTPRMTVGIELMNFKNGSFSVRKLIWDMRPTTATGIDL
jgi:hypothetical protein